MKFTIEKNILLENLNNTIKAISNKNVIPILNGIKFELTDKGLELTGSDSELTIKTFIDRKEITNVEKEGIVIIQSKYILDIIRKMPSDLINFELVDNVRIKIYTDNNQYNLNCLDAKEYPIVKLEENKYPITINGDVLKSIINQTVFAISNQELRPLLTGLNIKITGDILECIATDSYRLSKKTIKLSNPVENDVNIVIPGKNVMELEKILTDEEPVEIHIFNNKILFKYKNLIFQSNLLSGTYPNTSNLIPTEFEIKSTVNLNEYFDAVDRASLLTQGKDKNIVIMKIENNNMVINSYASEIGKVEEKLTVNSTENASINISFSSKYMLDALKVFKSDNVNILLNNDVKPIILKSNDDDSLIELILPIKTY